MDFEINLERGILGIQGKAICLQDALEWFHNSPVKSVLCYDKKGNRKECKSVKEAKKFYSYDPVGMILSGIEDKVKQGKAFSIKNEFMLLYKEVAELRYKIKQLE